MDTLPHPASRYPPISRPRKILCAASLAAVALLLTPGAALAAPAPAPPPNKGEAGNGKGRIPADRGAAGTSDRQRLLATDLFQSGRQLVLTVRTARPVALRGLQPRPDARRASSRYLCLALGGPSGEGRERRLCLGARRAKRRLGLEIADDAHRPSRLGSMRATVKRPNPRKLVVAFDPTDAGLRPGRLGWRVIESRGCEVRRRCAGSMPAAGRRGFRLRPVRAVGCTGGDSGLVRSGSRDHPVVALTFDDGPSEYTPAFLDVLREQDAPSTFFQVGRAMSGHEETMRRILAEGHEIGDHTMDHAEYPGLWQIAGAAALIESATHFRPCLFRPPGGAVDAGVLATAGGLGMRTVTWDVDASDWQNPGASAIHTRVLGAVRPGSIVVLHDGGGPRGGTLAALPGIIDALRGRGYRFATVSELLGNRLIYRPYG